MSRRVSRCIWGMRLLLQRARQSFHAIVDEMFRNIRGFLMKSMQPDCAAVLQKTLGEEKAVGQKLPQLAEGEIDLKAAS